MQRAPFCYFNLRNKKTSFCRLLTFRFHCLRFSDVALGWSKKSFREILKFSSRGVLKWREADTRRMGRNCWYSIFFYRFFLLFCLFRCTCAIWHTYIYVMCIRTTWKRENVYRQCFISCRWLMKNLSVICLCCWVCLHFTLMQIYHLKISMKLDEEAFSASNLSHLSTLEVCKQN